MDENENTKSGPEQNQPDAGPDVMQPEPPRKCKICGGPNHHGCGCEARQRRTFGITEPTGPQPAEDAAAVFYKKQPIPGADKEDDLKDILSPDAIREAHEAQMKSHKDIETIAGSIEGLCALMYDTNNYLKLITGDLITIRKFLNKEDTGTEPQDAH